MRGMLLALACLFLALPCRAQQGPLPRPGEVIDAGNVDRYEHLIPSQALLAEIRAGRVRLNVVETRPVALRRSFLEATRRYAGQTRLTPGGGLENYRGGFPFAHIDPKDPRAGWKIIWNFYWRDLGDDYFIKDGERYIVDRHGNEMRGGFHYYQLRPTGRVAVPPIPALKGLERFEQFRIIVRTLPRDQAGTAVLWKRYYDPDKWDDQWIYLPSLRRIRRFPTTQRCATRAPTDYNWDDPYGFDGKVPLFNWRLIGEQKCLALMHQTKCPYERAGHGLPPYAASEAWEVRDAWVLEQTPHPKRNPGYCYSRRIVYVDKECFEIPYAIAYDVKGVRWKEALDYWQETRTRRGEPFYVCSGGLVCDVQRKHWTCTQIPRLRYHVDNGLKPDLFTLSELLRMARMAAARVR